MARLFEDDFETGDLSKWSAQTVDTDCELIMQSTIKNRGNYALKAISKGTAANQRAQARITVGEQSELFARGYFHIEKFDPEDAMDRCMLISFWTAEAIHSCGIEYSGGKVLYSVRYRDSADNFKVAYSTTEVEKGKMFALELHIKSGELIEVFVNNEKLITLTDVKAQTFSEVRFGNSCTGMSGIETITYVDDAAVDTEYIGLIPPPPTTAETMSEMMHTMISMMMVVMIIRMMAGMMKGLKKS